MARISSRETSDGYAVTVTGALGAADLRRLERACGPAVERRQRLEIVLRDSDVTMDAAARAYVERLQALGATLRRRRAAS